MKNIPADQRIRQSPDVIEALHTAENEWELWLAKRLLAHDELYPEETIKRLQRQIEAAETPQERQAIAEQITVWQNSGAENRSNAARNALRKDYHPVVDAITALLEVAIAQGESILADAVADETALFESWGFRASATIISVGVSNTLKVLKDFKNNTPLGRNLGVVTGSQDHIVLDWFKQSTVKSEPATAPTIAVPEQAPAQAAPPVKALFPPFVPVADDAPPVPPLLLPHPVTGAQPSSEDWDHA